MDCTILAKRMCVFKLYLDSLLSESDWGGFVVPFWHSYDPGTQQHFDHMRQTREGPKGPRAAGSPKSAKVN